jgi:hypothetical protein
MATEIIVTAEFVSWYGRLTEAEQEAIQRIVSQLEAVGIALGFPQSAAIKGSKLPLRELRVQHMGEPYRVLYIFDPARQAVLLVGGNKVGSGNRWYEAAIPHAERLYTEYLRETQQE